MDWVSLLKNRNKFLSVNGSTTKNKVMVSRLMTQEIGMKENSKTIKDTALEFKNL